MKKIFTVFIISFLLTMGVKKVFGQTSTANYNFTSVIDGSLTDMSSGTTQLIAANSATTATGVHSAVQNIGFDFFFMGVKYSQFGVSSRGTFKFGSASSGIIATNNLNTTTSSFLPLVTPFWDALGTSASGSVKYKVTGSFPNRILTVEWLNMRIAVTGSTTADGTFQLRLYETTGKIEFVYGSMNIGTGSPTVTASIGFTTGNTNNKLLSVTNITSPVVTTLTSSVINNLVNSSTAGPISGLNSSSDGNRVVYVFTPPSIIPNAPTNLSFTSVNNSGMTLNWVDNAINESGYLIQRSTDGGTTYTNLASLDANTISYNATGLNPGTTYFWKVYAVTEGTASTSLDGSQATTISPPNPPTNLTFTAVNNIGMTLNWVDNSSDEVNFHIYKSTNGGSSYDSLASVPANTTSYVANGLNPGTEYFWRIYAAAGSVLSAPLQGSQSTTSIAPNPPTNLTFTNVRAGSMTLNWVDNSSDEINFKIQKSTDRGSTYFDLALLPANTVTYNATDLSLLTKYFWRVYAVGAGNLLSTALQDSQSTVAGTLSGLKTIGETGNFFTIQEAFDAINTDGLAGHVILELQPDYNPVFDFAVNCYGNTSGSSSSATVILRPAVGVMGLVFTSSLINFNFNGTKYLTIDGRPGGIGTAQEITISNTSTTGNAVRFINDASNNTIKYCKIMGVNTSSTGGVILQSTTTGITGNDNNTLNNCEIRDGASVPQRMVYNTGTTGKNNDGFTLSNCRIFNFSRAVFESTAEGTGSNYSFIGNSFYQSFAPPVAVTSGIFKIISLLGQGDNHLISGNYFGGQDINCGGNAFLTTEANGSFIAISLSGSTNVPPVIQNNTIQNINITGPGGPATFMGIEVIDGSASITGNIVGHNSTPNSISYTGINGITGIRVNPGLSINCSDNIIANIITFSQGGLSAISLGTNISSSNAVVLNNIIHDLTAPDGDVTGIGVGTFETAAISGNVIHSLKSTVSSSFAVIGIRSRSSFTNISKNRIYNLSNAGLNKLILGISVTVSNPNSTIANNQISIQNNLNTNDLSVTGIAANIGNIYYNSIYIGGSVSSGSANTSCIMKDSINTSLNVVNNILYNERTGGTGNHYALDYTNNNNITSNYNLLVGLTSTIARWGANTYNFADYKTNSGKDVFSLSNQPVNIPANNLFVDKSVGNMNILSANNEAFYSDGKGIPIAGQLDDYSSTNVRDTSVTQGTTDIGSDEFDYTGSIPSLTQSAPPALNTTTTYSFGGRQLVSIAWGNTGTVPSSVTVTYNSGVNPPGTLTGQYSSGYWEITPAGGSGYTYGITLNYSPAILFNIADENNIKIAKRDGGNWDYLSGATVNTTNKTATATGLNSFSQFALTSSDAPLPVELASFTSMVIRNEVILDWSTSSEINNASFEIERSQVNSSNTNNFQRVGSIQGNGTTNETKNYKFNDRNIQTGKYKYRLKQIDFNGNFKYFDLSNEIEVGIPNKYDLSQNYPNPFNPVTKINYDMPKDGKVNLRIYDITGREVAALINNEIQPAGYYTIAFNASNLSSGVYFYRLATGDFVSTKKMMLIK